MAAVEIRAVKKFFGATQVVHGVDITIADGEFVVLVGPSGCGKSTLLRMIAGLEQISAGEISIGGRVVNRVAPKERDVAMVFQNYALYPHMTVHDNMAFSLRLAKADASKVKERVDRAAQIRPRCATRALPGNYRAASASAVAMGRSHCARSSGVPVRRAAVQSRCETARANAHRDKELHQRLKTTSVYVTHDQVEGDDDGRYHRGNARRPCRADGDAVGTVRSSERICSWQVSSVRRR